MKANERRLAIRDYISAKRKTTIAELMQEFDASRSTIKRDIQELEAAYLISIESIDGKGGGIRAMDGWYANKTYFTPKQEALIRRFGIGLQTEDDIQTFETILATFVMPKAKAN